MWSHVVIPHVAPVVLGCLPPFNLEGQLRSSRPSDRIYESVPTTSGDSIVRHADSPGGLRTTFPSTPLINYWWRNPAVFTAPANYFVDDAGRSWLLGFTSYPYATTTGASTTGVFAGRWNNTTYQLEPAFDFPLTIALPGMPAYGVRGGLQSAVADGAGGFYFVSSQVQNSGGHTWEAIGHWDGSSPHATATTTAYEEWSRSTGPCSDPYAAGALIKTWYDDYYDPAEPTHHLIAGYAVKIGETSIYTPFYAHPFLTVDSFLYLWRQGTTWRALGLARYTNSFDTPIGSFGLTSAVPHSQPCLVVLECAGSDPTDAAAWAIIKTVSPYDLTKVYGDADFNRAFGRGSSPWVYTGSTVQTQGGSTFFTVPLLFSDSAGWTPPDRTTVWQVASGGTCSATFTLDVPDTGRVVRGGELAVYAGELYYFTFEEPVTPGSGANPSQLRLYHWSGTAWTLLATNAQDRGWYPSGGTDTPLLGFVGAYGKLYWLNNSGNANTNYLISYELSSGAWNKCFIPLLDTLGAGDHIFWDGAPPL